MEFERMVRSALLRLKHVDSHQYSGHLLWAAATDLFGIGSTSAHEVCRHFDMDPDERLPESNLSKIAERCSKEMDDGVPLPMGRAIAKAVKEATA